MIKNFKYLLFDLGGVLVRLTGVPEFLRWVRHSMTEEEFEKRWLYSDAVRLFESGKISADDFAVRLVKEFDMDVAPDDFMKAFSKFPVGMYEGAEELLESLAKRYPIACLSNTNTVHWEWLAEHTRLQETLNKCLLSFRIGLMKPDGEIFRYSVKELGCKPQEIIFFDDNPVNVEAAKEAGFNAFLVKGFAGLKDKLQELSIA